MPPSCLSCRHFRHTMLARIDTCAVVIQASFLKYEPVLRMRENVCKNAEKSMLQMLNEI
ncbi:conserved hypothetical protein [Actinomyces sp. oral taxon 180 str. F0310]|nr:conserved hypothetical protein [Actinomyces sp. oral taxon 180 str. F0310]